MMFEDLNSVSNLEPLDLALPIIPPRSRLYCLEPVGVGTPYVECLTSYLCRLAEEHSVTIYALLHREIDTPNSNASTYTKNKNVPHSIGIGLSGLGERAERFARRLEVLTGQKDLHSLTMLPWSNVITQYGLQRLTQAWCPVCLEESRDEEVIYIPLIWTFQVLTICVKHRRRLSVECAECGKKVPWLTGSSRCGICPSCKCWLGNVADKAALDDCEVGDEEFAQQSWVHDAIGECVAGASSLDDFPARGNLMKSLALCINIVTEGYIGKFGKLIDTQHASVTKWKAGKGIPYLQKVLEICALSGVTPFNFYTGNMMEDVRLPEKKRRERTRPFKRKDWKVIKQNLLAALQEMPPPSLSQVIKGVDIAAPSLMARLPDLCSKIVARHARHKESLQNILLRSIKAIADGDEYPPPRIADVCRRLKTADNTIKKLAPESYMKISNRFSEYKRNLSEASKRRFSEEIKIIAKSIHEEGNYPSFPKVAERLSSPSRMVREDARIVLREVQRELGYR